MQQFVDTRNFLSETKFYEGYSRYLESDGRYETWDEAVDRVIDMHEQIILLIIIDYNHL